MKTLFFILSVIVIGLFIGLVKLNRSLKSLKKEMNILTDEKRIRSLTEEGVKVSVDKSIEVYGKDISWLKEVAIANLQYDLSGEQRRYLLQKLNNEMLFENNNNIYNG